MSVFATNNCNENPLDPNCYCNGPDPTADIKIFDVATRSYICCGNINFAITSLTDNADKDNLKCLGWWNGSAGNLSPVPSDLPVIGTEFYLPSYSSTPVPVSYGPSDKIKGNITAQIALSGLFPNLPENSFTGESSTVTCPASSNPYWLHYLNPNTGQKFITTLVCSPDFASLKTNAVFTGGNWALYNPICTSVTSGACNFAGGELIGNPNSSTMGTVALQTPNYTGSNIVPPVPSYNSYDWLLVMLMVGAVVLLIVMMVIAFGRWGRETEPTAIDKGLDAAGIDFDD